MSDHDEKVKHENDHEKHDECVPVQPSGFDGIAPNEGDPVPPPPPPPK